MELSPDPGPMTSEAEKIRRQVDEMDRRLGMPGPKKPEFCSKLGELMLA
jgi:hypothetical protein